MIDNIIYILDTNCDKISGEAFSLLTIILSQYASNEHIINVFKEVVTSIPELAHNTLYDIEINILRGLIKSENIKSREVKEKLSSLNDRKIKKFK